MVVDSIAFAMQFGGLLVSAVIAYVIYKDKSKFGEAAWQASGQNNTLWVILGFLLGLIGLAIYWFAIRPKVEQAAQQLYYGGFPPNPYQAGDPGNPYGGPQG